MPIREWPYAALCLLWFFLVAFPGLLMYALGLGAFSLDLRFGWADPLFVIPGWSRNEITYFLPRWRPF